LILPPEQTTRIGYARVSTQEQTLNLQTNALSQAGCEQIIVDTASGKSVKRSGLDRLLMNVDDQVR
jgi:DNA invertase Pin-like site-specific DNA recombinase